MKQPCYASHQDVFSQESDVGEYVKKYILPASERELALWRLGSYNINAYSLTGTEESLLETLFYKRYVIEKLRDKIYPNSRSG